MNKEVGLKSIVEIEDNAGFHVMMDEEKMQGSRKREVEGYKGTNCLSGIDPSI